MIRRVAAVAAALTGLIALGSSGTASAASPSGKFSFSGVTWCPTYQAAYGCDNTQDPSQYSVTFAPSQVDVDSSGNVDLKMGSTTSGAIDTQTLQSFDDHATISVRAAIPCNSAGKIENWPGIWLDGATGTWPAHGEWDLVEGLGGAAYWHYHYVNASGDDAQVGAEVSGSWCGTHTFSVTRDGSASETFSYDGGKVGTVTSAEIGVPLATDDAYLIIDYGASSTYGGPTVAGAVMTVPANGVSTSG